MRFPHRLLLAAIPFLLAACGGGTVATPEPEEIRIGTTPAFLEQATRWVTAYNGEHPGHTVGLIMVAPSDVKAALKEGRIDIIIYGGTPEDGWFATPLLTDGIALIIHPSAGVRDIGFGELAGIFSGTTMNWEALEGDDLPVEPIIPLPGDDVRQAFSDQVLEGGGFSSSAFIGPNPGAIQILVEETRGGIGFLPSTGLTGNQGIVSIDGVRPSRKNIREGAYPLRLEILAASLEEPAGDGRAFLSWIQARED